MPAWCEAKGLIGTDSADKLPLFVAAGRPGQTGADIERLVRAAKASARRAGHPFSIADIGAQIPDPYNNLPARTRRRIAIYRNAQRIMAQC
ncbi:hypothetical protein N8D56_09090 [Devosia sp. A8/3-2]|nr:hypothetical protein N8D56_09090 [Devosia sp. A8/3-2]